MNIDFKEACRIFWLTKGHLYNVSDETILSCYDRYFRRLWGNNERTVYGIDGFEEAYQKRIEK